MQRPGGETSPQFRQGSGVAGSGPGLRPRMINMGRPYAPPAMHGRGPMMPPRPPFGPPPLSMLPTGNAAPPPSAQSMPAAPPPPNMAPSPPAAMPPPGPPTAGPPMPSPAMPPLAAMPPRPLPVPPTAGPPMPPRPTQQPLPPPLLNFLPPPPLPCAAPSLVSTQPPPLPPPPAPAQVTQGSLPLPPTLPSQPPRPNDEEIIRNIEILTQFVLKNGSEFENMARAKQAGNPKFSFLFGGEPGSDAALGHEYYLWFKMKCQLEQNLGREGEAKAQSATPSGSPNSNPLGSPNSKHQPRDSNVGSQGGPVEVCVVSDMEVDVEMEDDIAVPMLVTEHGKSFQTGRKEGELWSPVNIQQAERGETLDCQVKSLEAEGEQQIDASQLEFQKGKGKGIDTVFGGPCVEDVSPVRPLPKDLQHTLTIDELEVKSVSTLKEGPSVASSVVAESGPMGSSSLVDVRSETVTLADNKSGESLGHDGMDSKKLEDITPRNHTKSLNEGIHSQKTRDRLVSSKNNIAVETDNLKSNIGDAVKPNITLQPDNVKSEINLHGKPDEKPTGFDKYGRLMRKGNSDSESDGVPYSAKVRRDPSWSRSPSPGYDRRRKRSYSRSPRRKSRWSRSRSRSPKRRRSRSRTPLQEFRRGGDPRYDHISRGRGTPPPCNDFAKGRCYRGASCRFLHQDVSSENTGRWDGGRVKGRSETRQDMVKSLNGKDSVFSGELGKTKSISPDKFFDGHDSRNIGERKNALTYRHNDCPAGTCYNFSKGRCNRGASCKYLHPETTADTAGRLYGAGKGRERMENRQDLTNSFGGRDSFGGEVDKPESISPHRIRDEHYRHNFRDRRSQDVDRHHGRSVPACFFFARGACQKGPHCRFLHEDASSQNGGGRGRERPRITPDLTDSFGVKRISGVMEMDRNTNISSKRNCDEDASGQNGGGWGRETPKITPDLVESFNVKRFSGVVEMDRNSNISSKRNCDGQDSWGSLKQKSRGADEHNDSSANSVIKPQFSSPGKEKFQPHGEELWKKADAPSLQDKRENVEHHLIPRGELHSKSASWENVDGQPFIMEGSNVESLRPKREPDNPVEDLRLQPMQQVNSQFQMEHLQSNHGLHPNPFQPLSRDLPSHQHHGVTLSGQLHGPGGSSLSQLDTLRGTSSALLNVDSNIDPLPPGLPPGYPTNSSSIYPQSGIAGCSTPYQHSSIATKPNLVPQPAPEHGKFVQEVEKVANASTDMATTSTDQKPVRSQTYLEPLLQHVSTTGQEVLMPRPATMPPHLATQNKSGQIASTPFVLFGEQMTVLFPQCGGPLPPCPSSVNQPTKDISTGGDQLNPLSSMFEHSSGTKDFLKQVSDSAKVQDVREVRVEPDKIPILEKVNLLNKDSHAKPSSPSKVQDIVGNEKHKDVAEFFLMKTESHQTANAEKQSIINALENGSPPCDGGKNWSPGAATAGAADLDTEQAQVQDESKKSKEIRVMKQFRSAIAEFVKEALKPTWREGHMSKEAFKTIVKKVVDKVAGSLQSYQIPKTQERIEHYLASSQSKLTKLIQGYVDKYVKP